MLNRRGIAVGHGVEVERDDRNTIGELFDIFARRVEGVEVVQIGESTLPRGISDASMGMNKMVYLKNLEVPPILYPITMRRSREPSTSKTSMTGPYRCSTLHRT